MDEHRIVGFSSLHRDELDACSPDPQFGTTIDGDVRLETPHVVDAEAFAEELLGKTPKQGVDETNVAELAAPLVS